MDSMAQQIERIEQKLTAQRVTVGRVINEVAVQAFEAQHGVQLPEEYRVFITTIGNGCRTGPPDGGLLQLAAPICGEPWPGARYWSELPNILKPFPFTKPWMWEHWDLAEKSPDEGDFAELAYGSILIGDDGCGTNWQLIVTGPDRGVVWQVTDIGAMPLNPKRQFLQFFEDWLDGQELF